MVYDFPNTALLKPDNRQTGKPANQQTKTGFTLIELLLAILILSLALTCIYQTFHAGFAAQRFTEEKSNLYQNGRMALSHLSKELRCAFNSPDNPGLKFLGENSRLDYVSAYPDTLKEIGYFYDSEKKALMKREAQVPGEEPQQGGTIFLLAESVTDVNFEFFDGQTWKSSWEEETLPEGVKINLVLEDKETLNLSTKICLRR